MWWLASSIGSLIAPQHGACAQQEALQAVLTHSVECRASTHNQQAAMPSQSHSGMARTKRNLQRILGRKQIQSNTNASMQRTGGMSHNLVESTLL